MLQWIFLLGLVAIAIGLFSNLPSPDGIILVVIGIFVIIAVIGDRVIDWFDR